MMDSIDADAVTFPGEHPTPPIADPAVVVFDFDGTLVDQRGSWLLLQQLFGTREQGRGFTEEYDRNEITFREWCERNAALWRERGVTRAHVERAADAVKLTAGAPELLDHLDDAELPYGVVSGGVQNLQAVLDPFEPRFRIANELHFDKDGAISGATARVGPSDKDDVLETLCGDLGCSVGDVFYVGDSHTDEEALAVAGTSVLFDPDSRIDDGVANDVDAVVRDRDLRHVRALL